MCEDLELGRYLHVFVYRIVFIMPNGFFAFVFFSFKAFLWSLMICSHILISNISFISFQKLILASPWGIPAAIGMPLVATTADLACFGTVHIWRVFIFIFGSGRVYIHPPTSEFISDIWNYFISSIPLSACLVSNGFKFHSHTYLHFALNIYTVWRILFNALSYSKYIFNLLFVQRNVNMRSYEMFTR